MNSEEHRKFLESIRESQERSRKVLERIEGTIEGVRTTISEIQETNDRFDKIKQEYGIAMEKLAQKISNAFTSPLRSSGPDDQRPKPTIITMKEAVKIMMNHTEILFVTGAGVSADSGIPTFRGENGLYTKKFDVDGVLLDPEAFINLEFFKHRPQLIWNWIQSLQKSVAESKPNKTHILINQVLLQLAKKGKKPVLVTQNIDNLHLKPTNKQFEYHAIHGVAGKMRCSNLHYQPYNYNKVFEKCPQCQENLRPHIMFFDESYGIPFGNDVKDRLFQYVVVIGSSLNTGLCIKLVSQATHKIQINPHPVIEIGSDTHPFSGNTNQVLEEMLFCIKEHNF